MPVTENSYKTTVLETIRKRIVYMEYQPGMVLNEKDICSEFNVSRTPVREAFIELRTVGLVDIIPRSGTFVSKIDMLDLKNCFIVKGVLEGLVAELATTHIGSADIDRLERIFEKPVLLTDSNCYQETIQRDSMFHEILYENTFNEPLIKTLKQLEYKCLRGWFSVIGRTAETAMTAPQTLMAVLAAIKERDPVKAKQKMEEHIREFISQVKKTLE